MKRVRLGLNLDISKDNINKEVASAVAEAGKGIKPIKVELQAASPILKTQSIRLDGADVLDRLSKTTISVNADSSRKAASELAGTLSDTIKQSVKDAQGGGLLNLVGSIITAPLRLAGALSANVFRGAGESIGFGVARELRATLKKELDFDIYQSGVGNFIAEIAAAPANAFIRGNEQLGAVFVKIRNDLQSNLKQAAYSFGDALSDAIDSDGNKLKALASNLSKDLSAEKLKADFKQAANYSKEISAEIRDALASGARFQRIFDPLGESLAQFRETALRERALPLVLQRAQEISESGKKTVKAGTYFDKERGRERDLFVKTGNVVDEATKELIIAVGGYAKAQGRSGLRIPGLLGNLPEGTKAIGALNRDTDINAVTSNIDKMFELVGSLAKPNLRGFNKDAVEIAAQAIAALQKNPEIRIKILGESGGGYPAEEAKKILDLLGYGDRSEYLAVGTPDFQGRLDPSGTRKILSSDEMLGAETARLYRPLGLASNAASQKLTGAKGHPIENYLEFAELQNFVYGLPPLFTENELSQAKEAASQFKNIQREGKSNRELDKLSAQAFTTLQTVRRQFDLAEGALLGDLQEIAQSLESSFARFSEEPEAFGRTRQILARASMVLAEIQQKPGLEAQRVALIATKELQQLQAEFRGLEERKSVGIVGKKYQDLASEIEQTIDAFSLDRLITQARQAQQQAQEQARKVRIVDPNEGLNPWDKAYDIWADNIEVIEESGEQAVKVFKSFKGRQLGLDLGDLGASPAQQTAREIMDLVVSMVRTMDVRSVGTLNIKGVAQSAKASEPTEPVFRPRQLSLDFDSVSAGLAEQVYAVETELIRDKQALEKIFDLVGLGDSFRSMTTSASNTVESIQKIERDFLAIVPLGREAKAELQTMLSRLGMVAKYSAVQGAAGAAGGVLGAVQGVENAAFTALPFLRPAKSFIKGVGAPLALTAAATQIPGAGAALGGAIELAGTAGAGGAGAIATAIIDLIGQGVLANLPPQLVRAILTELPGFLPGLGGQSIAALAGGSASAVGGAVASGVGTIAAETITALAAGNVIIQAAKGSVQLLPDAVKRPALAAQELLALPAAQESQQAAARGTQRAIEATGRTTKAIAESPQVRARLRPAQEATAEVVSTAQQLPEATQPIALPAGRTFEAAIDRAKYLEEQFRRLQQTLYKVTQAMKADPGNLDLLQTATIQAAQLTKQADGAQTELRELREILKSTGAIDSGQSKQLTGYVGAIGQRAAEGRNFLAQLAQQYEASGRDIGRFISAGISAGMDPTQARQAAESIVKILIETTESRLGIQSPSRVFRRIGRFIAEGLGLGIKDGTGEAQKTVGDLTASVTKAAKPQTGGGQVFKTITTGARQAKDALVDLAAKAGLPIGALSKVGGLLKGVGIAALAFVAVNSFGDAIVQAGRAAFDTALQMERIKAQLEFINGGGTAGVAGAAKDLEFLNKVAKDTKQPVSNLADGYAQLKQAVKGTALEGNALSEIYTSLATNARVTGASTEQLRGQQLQLQQIFRKGKADTEDLNTLSENRLALQRKLQEVTGTSGAEFTKLLESGGITADKVAKAIKLVGEDALPGLDAANKTASASIGEFQRRLEQLNAAVGPAILGAFSAVLSGVTAGIGVLEDTGRRLEPVFGTIKEVGGIIVDIASPIVGAIGAIAGVVSKDLLDGFAVPFQAIRAGLVEIRSGIQFTFGAIGAVLVPVGKALKILPEGINPATVAMKALGAAISFIALTQLATVIGGITTALYGLAAANYKAVFPSLVAVRTAALAFIATPLGATLTAIGVAAVVAAANFDSLARSVIGYSKAQQDADERGIALNKEYTDALAKLGKGIPLTAGELQNLKDNLALSAKEGKDSANTVKVLTANLDRLQSSALAAAEIQGKLTAAMNASKKAIKEVSKEIDADYSTQNAALNESLANQQITRESFDAEELEAQQAKTQRYEELYSQQAESLQAALNEARTRLAAPIPAEVRTGVLKQVEELEDQLNDIEKNRGQARIEYLKGVQRQNEKIESDRIKRSENTQKAIQTLADAGAKTQGQAEQEVSAIKEAELQRRIKTLNNQIGAERNAAGELTDIGKNLYSERIALEADLQKSIADRTGLRSKSEAELVEVEEKAQKTIQALVQGGVVAEQAAEERISQIKQEQIKRRIALVDEELKSATSEEAYAKILFTRKELEAELTQAVAEGVNRRYDLLLKDVQREQESVAAVLSEIEARSLTDIQRLQTRGVIKQKQVDIERLKLTKGRLQEELAAQKNYIAELQKLPDPTDPEKRREAENTLRDAKIKTAQITQQLAEQEYQQQEKIREIAIDAIDERIKGQENLAKEAEEFAGVATRALENQNKLLEAQKSLKQSIASYDDQAYKILIDTEKSETEKAKLQELAAAARLRGLKETQAIERDILELQIEQERVANRVATVKAAAALERAKAEEEKTALNPEATDADKRAARLTTTAAGLELGALLQAGQLQDRLAQSRRAQAEIDDRRERLAARFELAQARTDKTQREDEIERLRGEAARGIGMNRARRAIDLALPRVDLHSGAIASIQKLGDISGEFRQLRELTSSGVVGNLTQLVNLQKNLAVQLNTLAAQPKIVQNVTNNPPGRSRVLAGSKG